jgi:hypothetical protein
MEWPARGCNRRGPVGQTDRPGLRFGDRVRRGEDLRVLLRKLDQVSIGPYTDLTPSRRGARQLDPSGNVQPVIPGCGHQFLYGLKWQSSNQRWSTIRFHYEVDASE